MDCLKIYRHNRKKKVYIPVQCGYLMSVYVAFVAEDSALTEPHFLNRIAATLAPTTTKAAAKIIHCELFFPDNIGPISSLNCSSPLKGESYGIYWQGKVFKVAKRFSRQDYIFKSIKITPSQEKAMKTYLNAHIGAGFNTLGYVTFLMPSMCRMSGRLPGFSKRFYCSQLTMEALNAGGVFGMDEHNNPIHMPTCVHPQEVFSIIDEYSTMTSHPARHVTLKL